MLINFNCWHASHNYSVINMPITASVYVSQQIKEIALQQEIYNREIYFEIELTRKWIS